MKDSRKIASYASIVMIVVAELVLASNVRAEGGKLQKFEDALSNKTETKANVEAETKKSCDQQTSKKGEFGKTAESLGSSTFETLLGIFLAGAFEMAQDDDPKYTYKYLKKNDVPALPTFRLEGMYQYLAGQDHAASGRLEVGYLMVGAEGEYKRFWEKSPDDQLNVMSGHVLLRSLFSEVFQINLALGEKIIWGDTRHDGFEIGFPFYMIFGKHVMFDVRPYLAFIGGHDVYDISSGISYKHKLLGVRAGYRAMNVDNYTLHGPEAGIFMQW